MSTTGFFHTSFRGKFEHSVDLGLFAEWKQNFKPLKHPIWNGVDCFSVDDERYYDMRFVNDRTGLTPGKILKRFDGLRNGNSAGVR